MNLKRFHGKTMAEALANVKRAFGSDAMILHTRTYVDGGVLGYGGARMIEITAARDAFSLPPRSPRGRVTRDSRVIRPVDGAANVVSVGLNDPPGTGASARSERIRRTTTPPETPAPKTPNPTSEPTQNAALPQPLQQAYQSLIEAHVADAIAARLVRRVRAELPDHRAQDPVEIRKRLAAHIEATLPVAGPAQLKPKRGPTVIALVGPTGVGKTTTLAKLAANFRLRQQRNVGLITVDTYRIAAVEQLRTYARIIDVPLEVAVDPDQVRNARDTLRHCDCILIDTMGRSQNDGDRLRELAELVRAARPDEVHLVLSLTAGADVLNQTVERFAAVGVNRLIFTKLDEAVGFGVTLNCLRLAEARLSYVTTGQQVPDDIEEGRGARLARLIVGGCDVPHRRKKNETPTPRS